MAETKGTEPGHRKLSERFELSNGTLESDEGYPRYRHIPRVLPVLQPSVKVLPVAMMLGDEAMSADA